jgi:hypothetical protein
MQLAQRQTASCLLCTQRCIAADADRTWVMSLLMDPRQQASVIV